jgi:cyclopropane fatty-acyl-phospholipid synthase-like methyltransferase
VSTDDIARQFDRECCARVERGTAAVDQIDGVAATLLDCLAKAGFGGGTVLELGSGDGTLGRELLKRGAQRVTGYDLSPRSVAYASERAKMDGQAERLDFRLGDGAVATLAPHDAVVSKKVFCCYPNADALLANSLAVAGRWYALVLPDSRGVVGVVARMAVRIENAWKWLTRDGFRAYVHDVREVRRTIEAAGFRLQSSRRSGIWLALAFSRD